MRIAVIGNLAGVGYTMAKLQRRKGLNIDLFIGTSEWNPQWEDGIFQPKPEWVFEIGSAKSSLIGKVQRYISWGFIINKLVNYDILVSLTGTLCSSRISRYLWMERKIKPYIAVATGSDIREVAVENSKRGEMMRRFFQNASKTFLLNIDMVELIPRLGLQNAEYLPFMIDTDKYSPKTQKDSSNRDYVTFFMPSHLDWGVTDNALGRNSTKGNDRFIRAFARYVKEGGKAKAIILDRGLDRHLAKKLIADLGITDYVVFKPEMKKNELIEQIREVDVVVDQFDVGAFGVTMPEAMACGKPVMIYLKTHCLDLCYPERPPVFNAHTEDEIYQQIKMAADLEYCQQMGKQARQWIMKYHHWEKIIDRLIVYYELLTGKYVEKAHCPDPIKPM